MTDLVRFPRTPHLAWLGADRPRDDKVLAAAAARALLARDIVVEEKVDGANLGFSVDKHGALRAQSRGTYMPLHGGQGQWKPLERWCRSRTQALADALFPDLMLFGEWCYAVHSIHYTKLPDWFLAFDIYDRATNEFWSTDRRNTLAAQLGVALVPSIATGRFDLRDLQRFLGTSRLADAPAEGLYLRSEADGRLVARAKLVAPGFSQMIEEHWTRRALKANSLVTVRSASTSR